VTQLTLTISRVWPSLKGGAVFLGKDANGASHKVIASEKVLSRPPKLGESWRIQGEPTNHPRFGLQLEASFAVPVVPEGEHLRRFLVRNRAFQGVGEVRARKLWERFGHELVALLDAKDTASLANVVGKEVASTLVQAWEETRSEARIAEWLDKHGFPVCLAGKILKLWGPLAPEKVQENPYRLLAVADWSQVDAAARLLGVPAEADCRRIAAVEATCFRVMGDKHTVIRESDLLRGVEQLLRVDRERAWETLRLAEADQAVVKVGGGFWQALGPYVMESFVRNRIAEMVAAEFAPSGHLYWQTPSDARVDELVDEFQGSSSVKLTEEQQRAVWLALTQRFGLILGCAGTGKTTVLKAIQWCIQKCEGTVHAVALAGRAAIRMAEATGHPARTIAGLLSAAERGDLVLGGSDLVVVDEASMVDLPLMYALLQVMHKETRMLLVGDPYQLPPIGMGLVFSALAEPVTTCDRSIPKIELTTVHRQAATTGIPAIAQAIRRGTLPNLRSQSAISSLVGQLGVYFVPCTEADAQAMVIELLSGCGGPGETQILSPIKHGPAGIQAINSALHHLRAVGRNTWQGFGVEDPVVWLTNDYERHIWNGTLGVVVLAGPASLSVKWDGHDRPLELTQADLEDLDLAYALSIHKAQGSQFRRVIVPVFPNRLLERTLIYTALTRAREQVIFVGELASLKQAVEAPPAPHRRNHGLSIA